MVVKNDEYSLEGIRELAPDKIMISPGPRTPTDSGVSISAILAFSDTLPVLGICLGHQCLAVAHGKQVKPAQQLLFGKTSSIKQSHSRIMSGLPQEFDVARYHSLVINEVPDHFVATSVDESGDIMSIEHKSKPVFGLQFHPESFLMESTGDIIIQNFLAL